LYEILVTPGPLARLALDAERFRGMRHILLLSGVARKGNLGRYPSLLVRTRTKPQDGHVRKVEASREPAVRDVG
jgi:hypothetical protein